MQIVAIIDNNLGLTNVTIKGSPPNLFYNTPANEQV